MIEPQEVALLQELIRVGRLTQDGARAFAQALDAHRAAGNRVSLGDALVARRVVTTEELARYRPTSDRTRAYPQGTPAPGSSPPAPAPELRGAAFAAPAPELRGAAFAAPAPWADRRGPPPPASVPTESESPTIKIDQASAGPFIRVPPPGSAVAPPPGFVPPEPTLKYDANDRRPGSENHSPSWTASPPPPSAWQPVAPAPASAWQAGAPPTRVDFPRPGGAPVQDWSAPGGSEFGGTQRFPEVLPLPRAGGNGPIGSPVLPGPFGSGTKGEFETESDRDRDKGSRSDEDDDGFRAPPRRSNAGVVVAAVLGAMAVAGGGVFGFTLYQKKMLEKRTNELKDLYAKRDLPALEDKAKLFAKEQPDEPRFHRYLALAYLGQEGKKDDALDEATKAASLSKDGETDLVVKAQVLLASDKAAEAKDAYTKALAKPGALEPLDTALAHAALAGILGASDAAGTKEHVQKALEGAPDDPDVQLRCGHALLLVGDAPGALVQLEKAVTTRPQDELTLTERAAARAASSPPNIEGALADLSTAIGSKPKLAPARALRAKLLLAQGKLNEALEDATEAGKDGAAVEAIACVWLGGTGRNDAEERIQNLVKAAPDALSTLLARMAFLLSRGKTDEALGVARDATSQSRPPSSLLLFFTLRAMALKSAGRYDEARNDADQLVTLGASPDARWLPADEDDNIVQAFRRRFGLSTPAASGHSLKAELILSPVFTNTAPPAPKLEEARSEIDACLRETTPPVRVAIAQALQAFAANSTTGISGILDTAIQSCPDLADLHAMRARLNLMTNSPGEASTEIDTAIRLEPTNAKYRYTRALIHVQQRNPAAALLDLTEAEHNSSRPDPAIGALRAELLIQGPTPNYEEAKRVANKVLEMDPTNARCLFVRGVSRAVSRDPGFDDDLTRAIRTDPGQLNWRLTRAQIHMEPQLSTHPELADQDLTDFLNQFEKQINPDVKLQVIFFRASARCLVPGKAQDAIDDVTPFLSGQQYVPELGAIRAFARSLLGQESCADDVRAICEKAPKAETMFLQRAQKALQLRLPGTWDKHLVVLVEASKNPQVKFETTRCLAFVTYGRGQWAEAKGYLQKVLDAKPGDQEALKLMEACKQKLGG
ncbi:hypothetical protein HY251_12265 [bacterium]|nr:hypothetical protein [bacterium]